MDNLVQTEWQRKLLLNMLRNYKKLRKSHFYEINGGLKIEKHSPELVVIDMWLMQLEAMSF